ncbi:hypothetical protein SYK_29930 [Pseudodesulfovibrio nedwellii]|uniref:Tetratricopeptide repeat protein n=1 Tax=Pseudodesulfovibrio nedwellii TaxID=2973072 RepID=A0ABM8B494_9BACT|nr:hypothetical protein [Pseudodesulfovibrio nedwellii]BDQ38633.1 hypothetical protein SYK_29930 [Pseudodesulfovibrio nedwellii]
MHRFTITILTAILLLATVAPAQAWRSIQNGDKNFERAWRTYTTQQTAKSDGYFVRSADAYSDGLKADPPSRTARFPSTLAKAGISFYYAKRYQECVDTMKVTLTRDKRMWEPALYTALSYARLGDSENTIKTLQTFVTSLSSQRIISDAAVLQVKDLEAGTANLDNVADALDAATQKQFIENISRNNSPRDIGLTAERCNGAYWWRRNMAPCHSSGIVSD